MSTREKYREEIREVIDTAVRNHATAFNHDYCFDSVISDEDDKIRIVIKFCNTIDDVWPEALAELRKISFILRCTPLLVGERTRKHTIQEGVVYTRGDVAAINLITLQRMLVERILPYIRTRKGGIYVKLDCQQLREKREARNLSRGDVAEEVGVSRRAIYEYERGMMNPTVEIAVRLEEMLETRLIEPINPLKFNAVVQDDPAIDERGKTTRLSQEVDMMFSRLGLDSTITSEAPFDMLTSLHNNVVLSCLRQNVKLIDERRLMFLARLSEVLNEQPAIITSEQPSTKSKDGIPVVSIKELMSIQNPNELISLIQERRGT